tara:strand:+ start:233 stop:409 length:177 start_codon:yes stop_codon:yes gene_type:complete
MNKEQLIQEYVKATIDGMDIEMMEDCLIHYMTKECEGDTYENLVEEVKEYYPEILEAK